MEIFLIPVGVAVALIGMTLIIVQCQLFQEHTRVWFVITSLSMIAIAFFGRTVFVEHVVDRNSAEVPSVAGVPYWQWVVKLREVSLDPQPTPGPNNTANGRDPALCQLFYAAGRSVTPLAQDAAAQVLRYQLAWYAWIMAADHECPSGSPVYVREPMSRRYVEATMAIRDQPFQVDCVSGMHGRRCNLYLTAAQSARRLAE